MNARFNPSSEHLQRLQIGPEQKFGVDVGIAENRNRRKPVAVASIARAAKIFL